MKKLIALLLTLACVFSLCATTAFAEIDLSALSDEELMALSEQITEEQIKRGLVEAPDQEEEDFQFRVEDFEAYLKNEKLYAKVKIRNLTDKDIYYAVFRYQLLDENGDALSSNMVVYNSILAGQAAWAEISIYSVARGLDNTEVKGICFTDGFYEDNYDLSIGGKTKYNFADYIDSDNSEATACALNDTAETDTVKLTVSEFFYEDQIIGSITQLGKMNPGDGEIWACIGLTLENVGKSQFKPYDVLKATIDYNDGYTYSTKDATSLILNSEMKAYYYRTGGIGMKLSPLTSEKYCLAISCSPKLREDTESPINVIFELPDGNGTKTFVYKVQ